MMIVFGFEYALLLVCFAATAAKFVLNAIDISRGGEWEDKATYVFYVDLADDLAKLIVYVGFFFTLTTYYGLPIHILRELYVTARSFVARCGDWVRYRKAMQNMHGRYPAVSQAELDTMSDATCIICREEMAGPTQAQADAWNQAAGAAAPVSGDTPKRLPCSHVFHFNCLRSWLERQQSCPTCRQSVLESEPRRAAGARDAPYGADQPPIDDPPAVSASSHQPDDLPVDSGSSVLDGASASAPSTTEPIQPPPLSSSSPPQQQHFRPKDNAGGTIESLAEQSLIPIFPNSTSLSAVHLPSLQEFPVPDLSTLSDEQIRRLDGDSRTAVEERIRILSAMQVQLSQMVVALTQVQSLHSGAPLKNRSSSPPAASKGKAPEI
ncbi:E3 ubiquitin-protein ligase hrd1 [Coemansia sp. RSA 2706]|nr:E3 ubiquitin-protein ligase hrd1 [Coemansia sp. RSA 2706]